MPNAFTALRACHPQYTSLEKLLIQFHIHWNILCAFFFFFGVFLCRAQLAISNDVPYIDLYTVLTKVNAMFKIFQLRIMRAIEVYIADHTCKLLPYNKRQNDPKQLCTANRWEKKYVVSELSVFLRK